MKNIYLVIWLAWIALPTVMAGEEDDWRNLYANTQNLGRKVMLMSGAQDQNSFEPELSLIKKSFESLVKAGKLQEKVFVLEFDGSRDSFLDFLSKGNNLSKLGAKYGDYTASEMLDIAKYFRGTEFKEEGVITLRVRLPAKELENFSKIVEELERKK